MNPINKFAGLNEGRRLEFKSKLSATSDLAKTIVAFGGNGGSVGGDGGDIGGDDGNQNIEEQITSLILQNDKISVQEIADKIGISKRNCERIIAKLKRCGVINRIGSARTGKWIIRF